MSAYDDALAAIPSGSGGTSRGIATVLTRIAMHLGYLVAHIDDKPGDDARPASDTNDLTDIATHAEQLNNTSDTVSRATNLRLTQLILILRTMGADWQGLTDEERKSRVTDVANRVAAVATILDTDLAGIDANAGTRN